MVGERRKLNRVIHWELLVSFLGVIGTIVGVAVYQTKQDTLQTSGIAEIQTQLVDMSRRLGRVDDLDIRMTQTVTRVDGLERQVYGPKQLLTPGVYKCSHSNLKNQTC